MTADSFEITCALQAQQAIREKCIHPTGEFTGFSVEDLEYSVAFLFERQARKHAQRPAIHSPAETWTYQQLNARANRLARAMRAHDPEAGEPVLLLLEKSPISIAALLATYKTGKIAVPAELSYTRERLKQILGHAEPGLILCDARSWELAQDLARERPQVAVLNADEAGSTYSDANLDLPESQVRNAAGLYFTSGSTGAPKALLETRDLLLYNIRTYTNDLHLTPEDRLSLVHSMTFTAINRNLFGGLLNGGCVFPFDPRSAGLSQLGLWLSREAITILHCPASMFRHLEGAIPSELEFPALRVIYAANEPVSRKEVEFYRARFSSRCIFANGLGCSELSTVCRYFMDKSSRLPAERWQQIDAEGGVPGGEVPVGYPPDTVDVLLLDENGRPVAGVGTGDLVVRSRLKVHGYWRRPDLTSAVFTPDPENPGAILYRTGDLAKRLPDGSISLLGRKDWMVKMGGHMVDPAAVEQALLDHPAVQESAVTVRGGNDPELIAYFAPSVQPAPSVEQLRAWLSERLGKHMTPARIIALEALPRNPRGKVDRAALPDPGAQRPSLAIGFVSPSTPVEQEIAEIWRKVLALDAVGIDDPFMELGGSSLQAARIASAISGQLHLDLPLASFWNTPTVRQLAEWVVQRKAALLSEDEIELLLAEAETEAGRVLD